MYKTEAQIVSHGILYLNPRSHQCQTSYKKYIAVQTPLNLSNAKATFVQSTRTQNLVKTI